MDELCASVTARIEADAKAEVDVVETFRAVRELAGLDGRARHRRRSSPRLSESWFCCAEPTGDQVARFDRISSDSRACASRSACSTDAGDSERAKMKPR
jgi:hypothetical protein